MLQLKDYQQRSLDTLSAYLRQTAQQGARTPFVLAQPPAASSLLVKPRPVVAVFLHARPLIAASRRSGLRLTVSEPSPLKGRGQGEG